MNYLMFPFLLLIRAWQNFISPGLAPRCKYYPSCSHYTYDAIKKYNILGILMGAWRVVRCNPFSHGGVDYVPDSLKLGPIKLEPKKIESKKIEPKKIGAY